MKSQFSSIQFLSQMHRIKSLCTNALISDQFGKVFTMLKDSKVTSCILLDLLLLDFVIFVQVFQENL